MLRAIGAKIEKTSNREACRDLSGRRLRAINEEKRLSDWLAKQADRDNEREERKKKKMDRLKQDFHHIFNDPEYFRARSEVADRVHEAVEQGIEVSSWEPTGKRKSTEPESSSRRKRIKRMDTMSIGVSDSESDSSEESNTDSRETGIKKEVFKAEEPISDANPTASTTQPEMPSKATISSTELQVFSAINLEEVDNVQQLQLLGLDHLKQELQRRGLKCGGTLCDRASRLFAVKGFTRDEINPTLFAKPTKNHFNSCLNTTDL